jgi:hypothetical protein
VALAPEKGAGSLQRVADPVPGFYVPLRGGDVEPEVDLGGILRAQYDRAAYDLSIDYRAEPTPALGDDDRAWADSLLRKAGMR